MGFQICKVWSKVSLPHIFLKEMRLLDKYKFDIPPV